MKKLVALVLSLLMATTMLAACSSKPKIKEGSTLTVGTPEMNGDFIWDFTNNSYDRFIKNLTSGEYYYSTYTYNSSNEFIQNPTTVKKVETETDADGNKTYTFELFGDLKWNDGSKLTAKDYVFGVLVRASREWVAQGTTASTGDMLVGYNEYHLSEGYDDDVETEDEDGNVVMVPYEGPEYELSEYFKGVQLISDTKFSLTISAENLPYFYEYVAVSAAPLCSAVWAPGCEIESNENGSRITGVDLLACLAEVASVERYAPSVTCGPYSFVSFENSTATLKYNEHFKGDLDGELPKFENVIVKYINQDTDVDQVIAGEVDLVHGVVEGDKIEAARAADTADLTSYKRYGYGMLAFHCDWGVTADENVRWALASLIDRNEVLDYVLGGYGGTVDGPYGLAMWQYEERQAELMEKLKPISFNIDTANDYLDQTEWKFEADGSTAFDASKAKADGSYMRYNSNGDMLVIQHAGSENNDVTRIIQSQYESNAPLAGVKFNVTEVDFSTLLDGYYYGFKKGDDRFFNSFNLANGFAAAYDPYYASDHSDFVGTQVNSTQISDAELDAAIIKMRELDPTQLEEHADAFVEYIVRWNELMPSIPLYSNEYFDIFNTKISNVVTTPFTDWAETICKIEPTA